MPIPPRKISTDLRCHRCSYNLRGLTAAARCPECGTPAQDSIYAADPEPDDPLADAERAYVRSLARSIALMLAAVAVAALTPAVVLVVQFGRPVPEWPYERVPGTFAADLVARALACASLFLLTRREPDAPPRPDRARTVAALILRLAGAVTVVAPVVERLMGGKLPDLLALPFAMASLAGTLAAGPYYWYLAVIAARLPAGARRVERHLRMLILVGPGMLLVFSMVRAAPRFALFALVAFGFPADDVARIDLHPLRYGPNAEELARLIPAAFLVYCAFVLAWLGYRLDSVAGAPRDPAP